MWQLRRSWRRGDDPHDHVVGEDDRSTEQPRADLGTPAGQSSTVGPPCPDERGAVDHGAIARHHLTGDAENAIADR